MSKIDKEELFRIIDELQQTNETKKQAQKFVDIVYLYSKQQD